MPDDAFRHEAFLFEGEGQFLEGTARYVTAGVDAGEPVLVMALPRKIELLRRELGQAAPVLYADLQEVGANPARLIPAWRAFVKERGGTGRRVRGVAEPIWAGRGPDEIVECQRHESLLNIAFADDPWLSLFCLYDTESLDQSILAEAMHSHPTVIEGGTPHESRSYTGTEEALAPFGRHLSTPPPHAHHMRFQRETLEDLRRFVGLRAYEAGLSPERGSDLVLAVSELANNSIRFGGGSGVVHIWEESDVLVAEVWDEGRMTEPLAGVRQPTPDQDMGRGLWLVNQLVDLMQMRSYEQGSVVRLHMRR
ncbi:MAG: anti-sigma factor RsbA family regulatory protein [Thermoleophilaceae bacterium]